MLEQRLCLSASVLYSSAVPAAAQDALVALLPPPASAANPVTIDLLVCYTDQARIQEGSDAAIVAQIESDVADANLAYTNSQIYINLRLVGVSLVNYTETSDAGTNLDRLQNPNDGYMDNVGALRDQFGADLVSLYTATPDPTAGAIGYQMSDPNDAVNADYGYSVVILPPWSQRYALAHELGHNMGAGHDRATGNQGAYSYSWGYHFFVAGVEYRTVMGYPPGIRVPYFSNPNVSYQGVPTGVAAGSPNEADNALTLNLDAGVVEAYRPADTIGPTAQLAPSASPVYGASTYDFQVLYSDNLAIRTSTLDDSDVVITGTAFTQAATLVSVDFPYLGAPRVATYRITAPGGTWDPADDGFYTVSIAGSQVSDSTDHFVAAGVCGAFGLNVPVTANLAPDQPANWPGKIVATTNPGTLVDVTAIYNDQNLYVNWAVRNRNLATMVTGDFYTDLFLDGQLIDHHLITAASVANNASSTVTDFLLGQLAAGTHTLRVVVDSTDTVGETDETDNVFTRSIVVLVRPRPQINVFLGPDPFNIIQDNQSTGIDFGTGLLGLSGPVLTFTVSNTGTADLLASTLTAPAGYSIVDGLIPRMTPGSSDTFSIRLDTLTLGGKTGQVAFLNNDIASGPFNFAILGSIIRPDPDLAPVAPAGWSSPLVVATTTGSTTDSATLYSDQDLFVDWAANNLIPNSTVTADVRTILRIDGQQVMTWDTLPGWFTPGALALENDFDLGRLSIGSHTLQLVVDSDGAVAEQDETNNTFTRTVSVTARPIADVSVFVIDGATETPLVASQPAPVTFSTVIINDSSSRTFKVRNDGVVDLLITNLSLPAGFSITGLSSGNLSPGESDTFVVSVDSAVAAKLSGSLTIASNDPDESTFAFPLAASVTKPDTRAPVAFLKVPNISKTGRLAAQFTVTYSDGSEILFNSVKHRDVVVTGPGYTQTAAWVADRRSADGHKVTTTYRITPPGGLWDRSDNGNYTVTLLDGEVRDAAGHYASGHDLGYFKVGIAGKARPMVPLNLASAAPAAQPTTELGNSDLALLDAEAMDILHIGSER